VASTIGYRYTRQECAYAPEASNNIIVYIYYVVYFFVARCSLALEHPNKGPGGSAVLSVYPRALSRKVGPHLQNTENPHRARPSAHFSVRGRPRWPRGRPLNDGLSGLSFLTHVRSRTTLGCARAHPGRHRNNPRSVVDVNLGSSTTASPQDSQGARVTLHDEQCVSVH